MIKHGRKHTTKKGRQKRLILYERIFNTTFLPKYLVCKYKPYNFARRYKERKETTETKAAKRINAHGQQRKRNACKLVI